MTSCNLTKFWRNILYSSAALRSLKSVYIMYKDTVRRSDNAHSFKTHLLIWFVTIIAFDVDNHTRFINILFEQNAEFFIVTARGKFSYQYGAMLGAKIFQNLGATSSF